MNYYYYEITTWFDDKENDDCGILCAETYNKAVEKLSNYYDENDICSINKIKWITDLEVLEFNRDEVYHYNINEDNLPFELI